MAKPEIRLKGFEGEWKPKLLSGIAKFSKGHGYSKSDLCEHGSPIILYGRLYTNYRTEIDEVDTFVEMKEGSVLSKGGEIIIPASGETPEDIACASVVKSNGIILGGDLNVLSIEEKNYNPTFTALSISYGRVHNELAKYAQGKTVVHLHNAEISKATIHYPHGIEEQQSIADYFKSLDSMIQGVTKKIASLKQMKQACLVSMFPQEGETTPRVRFKGFKGEWEKHALADIAKFSKGSGYSKNDLCDSGTPIILYGRLYTRYNTQIDNVDTFAIQKPNSVLSEGNEIIVPASGETPEDIACAAVVNQQGVILGGDLNVIRLDKDFDSYFTSLVITYGDVHYELAKYAQGKSVVHLHNSDICKASISYPSLKEQQQIASFFRSLDSQISLQEARLEKLKHIKSACLDKMFV